MEKLRTRIFLFLIVPFLFYFLVGTFVHVMGFWNLQEMYLVEKALLAVKGEPARFENVGLTYPPLPFLLLFLPVSLGVHLQAGVLLSSIYGALVILFLSSTLRDRLGFFFFPLIALHPLFLYSYSGGESIGGWSRSSSKSFGERTVNKFLASLGSDPIVTPGYTSRPP